MSTSASEIKESSKRSDQKSKGKSRTIERSTTSKYKQDPKKKSLHPSKNESLKSSSGKTTSEEGGRRKHGRSKESKDLVKSLILQSIEKTGGKETPTSGTTILYKVSGDKLSFASFDPYYPTIGARRARKKPFLPAVQEARLSAHKKHRLMTRADAVQQNQRVIVKNEAFKLNELLSESTEEVEFSSALFEDSFDDIARKNEQALRQKLKKDLKGKKSLKKETEEKVGSLVEEKEKTDEQEASLVPSKKATEEAKSKETSKHTSKETQETPKTPAPLEKESSHKTPPEETKEAGTPGSPKGVLSESLAISEVREGSAKKPPEKSIVKPPTPLSETLTYGERKELGGSISPGASDLSLKPGKSPEVAPTKPKDVSKKPGSPAVDKTPTSAGISAAPIATAETKKKPEIKPSETPRPGKPQRPRAAPTSSGEPAELAEQAEVAEQIEPSAEPGHLAKKESSQLFFVPKKKSQEQLPTVKRSKRVRSKYSSPFSPYYVRPSEGSVSSSSVTSDERGRPHPSGLSFASFCFLYQHYQAANEEIACCCETKLSLAELQSRSCRELCERDIDRRHVHHPTGLTFSEYRVVMS